MRPTVLLRAEQRDTEQRTPITPKGAAALHEAGVDVVVESSPERVFSDDAYEAVGCPVVHAGSWLTAPPETVVVGIKELPEEDRGRYNTLAGMIMLLLGRLPRTTDAVEWGAWRFEVVDLDGKRVDKVLVTRLADEDGEDEK